MLVRPAGSAIDVIDVIEEQPQKALLTMLVRPAAAQPTFGAKHKDGAGRHCSRFENAVIEASGQLDQHQRGAATEGPLTDAREAGGQLDRRQ